MFFRVSPAIGPSSRRRLAAIAPIAPALCSRLHCPSWSGRTRPVHFDARSISLATGVIKGLRDAGPPLGRNVTPAPVIARAHEAEGAGSFRGVLITAVPQGNASSTSRASRIAPPCGQIATLLEHPFGS